MNIYFFFIQNWIYQTFVVLNVEIQNEKQENIWFKIQQNFKLLKKSMHFNLLNFYHSLGHILSCLISTIHYVTIIVTNMWLYL